MSLPREREAEPRRLVQFRGWRIRLAVIGQIIAGAAAFVSVFAATTWLLSDYARPSPPGARLAPAENWPEIKDGVPELKASPSVPARQAGDAANGPREQADPRTMRIAEDSVPGAAPIMRGFVQSNSTDGAAPVPADRSSVKEAAGAPAGASAFASKPEESSRVHLPASGSDDEPRSNGAVIGATPQKETSAPPKTDGVPAAIDDVQTGALAPPLLPAARTDEKGPPPKQQDKTAPLEPQRQGSSAQMGASGAAQTSPAKARLAKKTQGAEPRKKKAARTRTAAAQPQAAPQAAPEAAAAQPAEEARKRFLGIPLPTGTEVRQCLFELRC
jgi:hypothetical protein